MWVMTHSTNMQEYELKYVNQFTTGKDGQPYKDKKGNPFCRVSVKVAEHGDNFISGLFFGPSCPWEVGDKVPLIITKEVYQGKEQLKFELPKKENPNAKHFEEVKNTLAKHGLMIAQALDAIKEIHRAVVAQPKDDYPELTEMPNFEPKDEIGDLFDK